MTYILLMFMWSAGDHSLSPVSSVEFASLERCESAAQAAKSKFSGWEATFYYTCVQK